MLHDSGLKSLQEAGEEMMELLAAGHRMQMHRVLPKKSLIDLEFDKHFQEQILDAEKGH